MPLKFVNPEEVVRNLDVRPGMKIADFGAGAGFYTLALAKRAGPSGKIIALDIRKEMLEVIRSKAREARLLNVETIWSDLEAKAGTHLKENSLDLVLISNLMFQVQKKENIAGEAFRILKPEGRVVLVEWAEEEKPFGPALKERVNRKAAEDIFLKVGFAFEKEFGAGENHYGLILKKP